jgi:aspartate kinase
VCTLGRGGSDTTAVALAAALGAERCQILSDVDGVYTADPRLVPTARKLDRISHGEMQELARHGARVLNREAVRVAQEKGVVIEAAASFEAGEGTRVEPDPQGRSAGLPEVRGVAAREDVAWIRARSADREGCLATELRDALHGLELLHEDRGGADRPAEMVASLENEPEPRRLREQVLKEFGGAAEVFLEVGAVAAVGRGLGGCEDAAGRLKTLFGARGVEMRRRLSRPDSLSLLVDQAALEPAVKALHHGFFEDGGRDSEGAARAAS